MKRHAIYIIGAMAALFAGCDCQRDLYDTASPMLEIKSDWTPSLNRNNMLEATVMLYKEGEITKEFFSRPNDVTVRVSRGQYDILVFNGVMESKDVTNLDHIYFNGTSRPETFEVCADEVAPNRRIARADGEYIASNEMEIFAFAHDGVFVEGDREYYLKYRNGHNVQSVAGNYVEKVIELTPRAVSYRFQVVMTNIVNPQSARYIMGSLPGFAGSVFPVSTDNRPKTGFSATHHLNFSASNGGIRTNDGEEIGTVQSPVFVTFGPPLPESLSQLESSGRFMFYPSFVLTDNSELIPDRPIDITAQVNEAIRRIYSHHNGGSVITYNDNLFTIEITDRICLPIITPDQVVDVTDWEDDEEVVVWIRP